MDEIIYWSATKLAEAIRTKQLSSLEVVDAHLRCIAEVNPKLNAIVQLTAKRPASKPVKPTRPWLMARSEGRCTVCLSPLKIPLLPRA